MKPARPKHCKDCMKFHSAGRANPTGGMEKYNAWCCAHGTKVVRAISWCKTHGAKVTANAEVSRGAQAQAKTNDA